jgi:hypothetical protein
MEDLAQDIAEDAHDASSFLVSPGGDCQRSNDAIGIRVRIRRNVPRHGALRRLVEQF